MTVMEPIILGIESSCDDTSAAVIRGRVMLSNVIAMCYFLVVLFRLRRRTPLSISPKGGLPEKKLIGSIFAVGVPVAVTTLCMDLYYMIFNRLVDPEDVVSVTVNGIEYTR